MGCNSKNKKNKAKSSASPAVNNDQLGENASEEFKSEDYTNASQRVKK